MKSLCVSCLKTISSPSRVEIYEYLYKVGPKSVSEVVSRFDLTQPTVSYHLKELEKAGLLIRRKKGRVVKYEVSNVCVIHGISPCPVSQII